ncbi:MAG: hypothetical protein WDM81_08290 [Rhizomicrobium sp.]
MMRGPAAVNSWAPSLMAPPDGDTVQRLAALYGETDLLLAKNFANAQERQWRGDGGGRGRRLSGLRRPDDGGGEIPERARWNAHRQWSRSAAGTAM